MQGAALCSALRRDSQANPDRRAVPPHVPFLGLERIDFSSVEPGLVRVCSGAVVGQRDLANASLQQFRATVSQHFAELTVHIDEASLKINMADADRRQFDEARVI